MQMTETSLKHPCRTFATKETCNAVVGLELGDQDASSSTWTSLVSASHFSIPVPDLLPETLIDGNDFGRENAR